jgi:hypothetical protein
LSRNARTPHTGPALTSTRKTAFLDALRITGIMAAAAKASKIDRSQVWRWRRDDEEFAKAYDEAEETSHEMLVNEARRRAEQGVDEYVVSAGRLVMDPEHPTQPLKQRRYSDQLIKFLIERREGKPLQRVEHSGDLAKPKELAPAYVAEVLTELNRRDALAPGENS